MTTPPSYLQAIPVGPKVPLSVPAEFAHLNDLAYNLWWGWHPAAAELFRSIDGAFWSRNQNPVPLLQNVEPSTWEHLSHSESFHDLYDSVSQDMDLYLSGTQSWYAREHSGALDGPIAYLCAEFGIQHKLRTYSGGLGILAGDHVKAASDLKTTTIRLLTGLAQPTTGSAWVAGIETTNANNQARATFGYLPQDPSFYTWMTAREYLDYIAQLFRLDKQARQKRVMDMLAVVGLETAVNRKIGGFSGGMKQRLGIAQAMIQQPPVLFLDEPTSALDPAGRHELLSLIESLRGQVTVFLSSHILSDVERVCDTVGIIHEGQLLLVTDREELLAQYASNIIALHLERNSLAQLEPFKQAMQAQTWVYPKIH